VVYTGINIYKLAVEKGRDSIFTTIATIWKPDLRVVHIQWTLHCYWNQTKLINSTLKCHLDVYKPRDKTFINESSLSTGPHEHPLREVFQTGRQRLCMIQVRHDGVKNKWIIKTPWEFSRAPVLHMHAKAPICFNFFIFHPVSTKFTMFFVFGIATFWRVNYVKNLAPKN
jgi:hypothetical protein